MDPHAQGPSAAELLIGQTIGNYLVTQKLGEGGMGSVYLAEHPTIGKKVALKVLHSEFSSNQEVAARFFNEAKAVNDIGHPNIVDIVDFGIIQAGMGREQLVYFIMEYLSGFTLSQLIRNESPLPPERSLAIALQVGDALTASHSHGIIHRDLKPDNIMLQQRGRERDFVKLLDFGIAKLTGDAIGSHRTRTGIVMGTPAYMSPEQCEGRGNIDHRTDIYALGIVLYEMLTGRVPFIGEGYGEILVQHLTQPPIAPSQYRMMPPHVEQVVLKALEKRPDLRYPNMDEMMRAMADPVGYVEANGGLTQFLKRQLMPSSAPLPHNVKLTPAPLTPAPGTLQSMHGLNPRTNTGAGATTPSPTMGGRPEHVAKPTSKLPFIIAALVIVAGAGIAIAVVAGNKKTDSTGTNEVADKDKDNKDKPPVGSDKGTAPPIGSNKVTTPPVGSDKVATDKPVIDKPVTDKPVTDKPVDKPDDKTVPKITFVKVDSKPAGAAIWVDGVDSGHITPFTFEYPRGDKRVTITLHLDKYDDRVFKDVVLDKESTLELFDDLKAKPVKQTVIKQTVTTHVQKDPKNTPSTKDPKDLKKDPKKPTSDTGLMKPDE